MFIINKEIFRAYDIRGHSADISKEISYGIGLCFAKLVVAGGNNLVCVGRDGRLSSPIIHDYLVKGLKDAGAQPKLLGVVPTPLLYFADKTLRPVGSIMVTGSHNPKDDNGFKLLANGVPFFGQQIQELLQKLSEVDWTKVVFSDDLSLEVLSYTNQNIIDAYLEYILQSVKLKDFRLKVAWDIGNGATGDIIKALVARLPNDNIVINEKIDGNFPNHHPDPTNPKNLQQLIHVIKERNCDVGIAFDGDGDRIGVVSANGDILFGDQILCIFAKDILRYNSNSTIILDVKASQFIVDKIKSYGGNPVICRTGHPFIKNKMYETKALLAGEMSGHIFFADKYFGFDDAIYAALRFLDLLVKENRSLDEIIEELPSAYGTPEIKIFVPPSLKLQIIQEVKEQLIKDKIEFSDIDGVRVLGKDGWWLMRTSNTESTIVIRAESNNKQGLVKISSMINNYLKKYNLSINY